MMTESFEDAFESDRALPGHYMANVVCNGFVWNRLCVCVFGVVLVRGAQRLDETCVCVKYCPGQHL
eukprot:5589575-Lingulodinium_polyedra.AAC.1